MKRRERKLRRWLRELRELCPTIVPVKVRRRPLNGYLGYTTAHFEDGKLSHFRIVLDRGQSWDSMWQVLVHEWAHCKAWHEGHETVCDHDAEWGIALSRIYQEMVDI